MKGHVRLPDNVPPTLLSLGSVEIMDRNGYRFRSSEHHRVTRLAIWRTCRAGENVSEGIFSWRGMISDAVCYIIFAANKTPKKNGEGAFDL